METGIFSSGGRIRRSTYWLRCLAGFAVHIFAQLLMVSDETLAAPSFIVTIAVSVFILMQGVKRMHDVNKSGWYIIIPIYSFILLLTDGTPGPNDYGDDPKGRGDVIEEEIDEENED